MADRAARWALRRQGETRLPWQLAARRLYILPTRSGMGLGVLVLVCLFAGLNYGNGMALLLAFSVAGFGIVALHQTHRQLLGLHWLAAEAADSSAGGSVLLTLQLRLPANTSAPGLRLQARLGGRATIDCGLVLDPAGQDLWRGQAMLPALAQRGRWRLPPLRLSSLQPYGLFTVWTWLQPEINCWIAPVPAGDAPLPESTGEAEPASGPGRTGTGDDWRELRPWRDGDSLRRVAWNVWARGGPLVVREFESPATVDPVLTLAMTQGPDLEARLAQLAAWLQHCEQRGRPYRLELPAADRGPDRGPDHYSACLKALAQHGDPPPREPG
ncbi:MAG: hypothetical protein RL026_191 [Pseudomonadota bacterium]